MKKVLGLLSVLVASEYARSLLLVLTKKRLNGFYFCTFCLVTTSFNVVAAPPAPSSISAPSSANEGQSYRISWNSVPGATKYELVGELSGILYTGTYTYRYRSKSPGTYYYKVRACDNSGCGAYSGKTGGTNVVAVTPTPGTPSNFASSSSTIIQGASVTLTWSRPSNTTSGYYFKLYGRSPGSSESFLGNISSTSSTRTLNYVGQYRYRVQACNTGGVCGGLATLYLTSNPPTPATPSTPTASSYVPINQSYAISWGAVAGTVSHYELYENNIRVYSGSGLSVSRIQSSSGNRQYQVKACNTSGCSAVSGTKQVYIYSAPGTPTSFAASPATIIQNNNSTLSWLTPAGTVPGLEYKLYATAPRVAEVFLANLTTNSSMRTLAKIGQYQYRIRACNPNNLCGGSATVYITSNPSLPGKVGALSSPTVSPVNTSFSISWPVATGVVDRYELYLGSSRIFNGNATSFNFMPKTVGDYVFNVKSCNTSGCGIASNNRTVTVYTTPNTINTFTASSSTITVDSNVTLSWSAAPGAVTSTYYQLFAITPTAAETLIEENLRSLSSVRTPGYVGTYEYRVKACSPNVGCSLKKVVMLEVAAPAIGVVALPSATSNIPVLADNVISWSTATGASNYYQLYENGVSVYFGTARTYTANHSNSGNQTYKVRACHKAEVCGEFSAEKQVYVYTSPGTPTNFAASPATIIQNNNSTLSWLAPAGTVPGFEYKLYATAPGVAEVLLANLTTNSSMRTLANVGLYQYRIVACNPNDMCSASSTVDIKVDPNKPPQGPSVEGQDEVPVNTAYQLNWNALAYDDVDSYELFENGQIVANNLTTYTQSHVNAATISYKVRACNVSGCGEFGPSKNVIVFDKPGAPLGFSANKNPTIVDQTITLSWNAPVNAVSVTAYNLYATTPSQSEILIEQGIVGRSSVRIPRQLGAYQYRLEACSGSVGCGGSATVTFDVIKPEIGVPGIPVTPAFVAINTDYEVSWAAATGEANIYQLYEKGSEIYIGSATTTMVSQALTGNNIYEVRACSKLGVCGDFSAAATAVSFSAAGAPANLRASKTTIQQYEEVSISWDAAEGEVPGVAYQVYADSPSTTGQFLEELSLRTRSKALSQIGQYTYYVRACNPDDVPCGEFATVSLTVTTANSEDEFSLLVNDLPETVISVGQELTIAWNINFALSCIDADFPEIALATAGQKTKKFYWPEVTQVTWLCTMPDESVTEFSQAITIKKLAAPLNLNGQ